MSVAPIEVVALTPEWWSAGAIERLLAGLLNGFTRATSIVVPPPFAKRCVEALRGRDVRVASVVAYPLGLSKPTVKAIEATSLAKDDVDAIEVTPYPANVLDEDWDALRAELLEIVRGARAARPGVTIDVRVDAAWVRDEVTLLATVQRAACDGLIIEHDGQRERRSAPQNASS